MKIGMLSTLAYKIPPDSYGGVEIVVHHLTEELVKRGHEVTLFACKGSKTMAKLDTTWGDVLENGFTLDNVLYDLERLKYLNSISDRFDIIHNHTGYLPIVLSGLLKCPVVTTWHAEIKPTSDVRKQILRQSNLVSISLSQQKGFSEAGYVGNVYHGAVDLNKYYFGAGGEDLVWIGRFNPYKGAKEAIEVAKRTKRRIILAGRIEPENMDYYKTEIEPDIDGKTVLYLGEIGIEKKAELLSRARAFLMPISWEEPFGLVMIEAMACGTPVIAFRCGAAPEVVEDGVTGFITLPGDIDEMAAAVGKIDSISREACRKRVSEVFSPQKMAQGYEDIYKNLMRRDQSC